MSWDREHDFDDDWGDSAEAFSEFSDDGWGGDPGGAELLAGADFWTRGYEDGGEFSERADEPDAAEDFHDAYESGDAWPGEYRASFSDDDIRRGLLLDSDLEDGEWGDDLAGDMDHWRDDRLSGDEYAQLDGVPTIDSLDDLADHFGADDDDPHGYGVFNIPGGDDDDGGDWQQSYDGDSFDGELVPGLEDFSDDDRAQLADNVIANEDASWFNRMRRKAAFKVGLDWGMPNLGYMIDYDRDRHAGMDFAQDDGGDDFGDDDLPDGWPEGYGPDDPYGGDDGGGGDDLHALQEEVLEAQLEQAQDGGDDGDSYSALDAEDNSANDRDEDKEDKDNLGGTGGIFG